MPSTSTSVPAKRFYKHSEVRDLVQCGSSDSDDDDPLVAMTNTHLKLKAMATRIRKDQISQRSQANPVGQT